MELDDGQRQLLARHGLLAPLVTNLVIADAVTHLSLSEEQKQQALQGWAKRQNLRPDPAVISKHCQMQGISDEDFRWQVELPIRVMLYGQEHFSHRAEQRFLKRKTQLDQVIYSLLRVQDAGLAQELYLQIAEGEAEFADLAAVHSQGPEQSTRGLVGPAPLTQAHPKIVEMLRSGQDGQLFAPVRIDPWSLIVRREKLQPAVFNDRMKMMMTQELFDEWVREEVQIRLKTLCSSASQH